MAATWSAYLYGADVISALTHLLAQATLGIYALAARVVLMGRTKFLELHCWAAAMTWLITAAQAALVFFEYCGFP